VKSSRIAAAAGGFALASGLTAGRRDRNRRRLHTLRTTRR
jgi:hypothetical protein